MALCPVVFPAFSARHLLRLRVPATREREGDLQEMVDALKNGKYSALILDAPVLEHTVGTNEECDLFLVGDMFETFSIALAFPPAFSDAVIYAFSQSIVRLQVRRGRWLWIVMSDCRGCWCLGPRW